MKKRGLDIDDIDQRLDEISPAFKSVTAAPLSAAAAGWLAGKGRSGTGRGGPDHP